MNEERFKKAILDPPSVYRTPSAVLSDRTLTSTQKAEILRRWEYEACEVDVAEEEGMPRRDGTSLQQILQALQELVGEMNTDETPPTKQGGLPRSALRRRDRTP
ncbi:MAG: hypothetical protein ACSHXH_17970 [Marivita sp.]|uniref:hypothetical protein n=1 Tax=Marivita sp. TaxID=2003365 RepID=UPI003EF19118